MKILIIHAVSIDKSLLISPVIRVLKSSLDAEVHLVVYENDRSLFQENPYVDNVHVYNTSIKALKRDLKSHNFDWTIDFTDSWRSKILRLRLSKKQLVFNRNTFKHWIYIKTKINLLPKTHLVDQYLELLGPLNVKGDNLGIDFYIPEKDEVENNWLPSSHQNGYAAIAISASHHTRQLPVNRLIELCDRINKPIVLIGEKNDLEVANEVEDFFRRGTAKEEEDIENLNKKAIIFNACGKFNFNQSASLLKDASWVFTYDNVMMHIAAAFKKRIYTMWGNTTPHFGTYPYRTQFTVFENTKLSCRPCSKKGFYNCPKGHFKCMNDLTFDFYLPD